MAELDLVFEQLHQQNEKLNAQSAQLMKIEILLIENAIQNTKITELETQVDTMWNKYDTLVKPSGTIAMIEKHQASCPRLQFRQLWWAFSLLATLFTATLGIVISHIGGSNNP